MKKTKKPFISEKLKAHLISAGVTFLAAFAVAIIPHIDTISLEGFKDGTAIAIVFTAARAGVKALFEFAIKK